MDKQKEENVKVYMRSVMRLGKFFNNYKIYFADNEQKRKEGEGYYNKRISAVLREVDALSEEEKHFFYESLKNLEEQFRHEEAKRLKTLQFGYAKICRESYMAIETVFDIKRSQAKEDFFEKV